MRQNEYLWRKGLIFYGNLHAKMNTLQGDDPKRILFLQVNKISLFLNLKIKNRVEIIM